MREWCERVAGWWALGALLMVSAMLLASAVGTLAQTPAPALTEVEQLRTQLLAFKLAHEAAVKEANDCRGNLGTWRAQYQLQQLQLEEQTLKADVEKAHPGFTFDPRAATLTPTPKPGATK